MTREDLKRFFDKKKAEEKAENRIKYEERQINKEIDFQETMEDIVHMYAPKSIIY